LLVTLRLVAVPLVIASIIASVVSLSSDLAIAWCAAGAGRDCRRDARGASGGTDCGRRVDGDHGVGRD
jgi:hypothetical protein